MMLYASAYLHLAIKSPGKRQQEKSRRRQNNNDDDFGEDMAMGGEWYSL
jgi:hypothetical protein